MKARKRNPKPNTNKYPKSRSKPNDPNVLAVPKPTFIISKK